MDPVCVGCGERVADIRVWRCPRCGGPLEFPQWSLPHGPLGAGRGLTRFRPWIPAGDPVSIGEPPTPLVEGEAGVVYKLEGALPTGSFKDRGSAFLVGRLLAAGVSGITVDSSGNAGASLAAYGAAAGIAVRVFVPAHASGPKLSQMRAYGAEVVPVAGTRSDVGTAALAAATDELVYASHIWNPAFVLGTQTFAFELFEQLGAAPAAIVCPLGAGTLLLGCYYGFRSLCTPTIAGMRSHRPACTSERKP